jgi:hypothetical protein
MPRAAIAVALAKWDTCCRLRYEIHRVLGPNGVALFDIPLRRSARRPAPGSWTHRPFWLAKRALVRTGQVLLNHQPERLIATITDAGFDVRQHREFAESIGVLASVDDPLSTSA